MEFYTIRDKYDAFIGEYDSRDDALSRAEECGRACIVYAGDCVAIASFEKGGFRNA
jgi:hypothetical protein